MCIVKLLNRRPTLAVRQIRNIFFYNIKKFTSVYFGFQLYMYLAYLQIYLASGSVQYYSISSFVPFVHVLDLGTNFVPICKCYSAIFYVLFVQFYISYPKCRLSEFQFLRATFVIHTNSRPMFYMCDGNSDDKLNEKYVNLEISVTMQYLCRVQVNVMCLHVTVYFYFFRGASRCNQSYVIPSKLDSIDRRRTLPSALFYLNDKRSAKCQENFRTFNSS